MLKRPTFYRRIVAIAVTGAMACGLGAMTVRAADEKSADGATMLFNGKDTDGWKTRTDEGRDRWKVVTSVSLENGNPKMLIGSGDGTKESSAILLSVPTHGADLITEKDLGDGEYHVEFMVPEGSNSGVYLLGRYEVQVFDSYGKDKPDMADVGAIYSTKVPSVNAAKPAGQWQSFDIVFQGPRFDASGKKTQNAKFISVKLNGTTIHENVEAPKPTGLEISSEEAAKGPLMLQGDHGVVAYRNIWYKPMADATK